MKRLLYVSERQAGLQRRRILHGLGAVLGAGVLTSADEQESKKANEDGDTTNQKKLTKTKNPASPDNTED